MPPINFPKLTRTKTEAQQLAAEIFPAERVALAQLKPGTTHPRYQLTHDTADTLRAILFWLHEEKPKIYKRARWHLFYDLANRAAIQLDENAQAKVYELHAEDRAAAWQRLQAAQLMTGDGQGTMISQHLPDAAAREQFASDFRLLCVAEYAQAAACMTEVWLCPPDGSNCRPSLHPDRQEFVRVNIELLDGEDTVSLYPIIRMGDAKPMLGQSLTFPRQPAPGMLMGFLPQKTPTESERIVAASLLHRTGRELHQFPLPKI